MSICLSLSPLLSAEAHGEEDVVGDEQPHILRIQLRIFVKVFAHCIKRLTNVFPETTTSAELPENEQLHVNSLQLFLNFRFRINELQLVIDLFMFLVSGLRYHS